MNRTRIAIAVIAAFIPFTASAQSKAPEASAPKAAGSGTCSSVKLTTSMGPITLALDQAKAPISSENFARYVKSGHYNGTIFHRVMDGFMIQGGGFTKDMVQKPTNPPIRNEASNGRKNEPYTVAMARTNDPNSATSQFFINVVDNGMLNYTDDFKPGYAVFGKVTAGQDTVDKIRKVATGSAGGHQNVPTSPVTIEKAECL
ncbi:MAG: peptidylprolyl isomerase [Usitatibacter sp.]